MTTLHQVHSTIIPRTTYYTIRHQAVDLDFSLSRWIEIILTYVASRPQLAELIYETYMGTNGHVDTTPELPAVKVESAV